MSYYFTISKPQVMASLGSLIPEYLAQFVFPHGVGQVIVRHTRCYQVSHVLSSL